MAFSLPTRKEWRMIFDNLSKKEKVLFLIFFLTTWTVGTLILIKIDKDYSTRVPADGGHITEGIVGTPRFINPLLSLSDADRDFTQIIYAGLMKSDGKGNLAPDLAERYEVSDDGLVYTFYLRDGLYWHDNERLTSDDVVFTVNLAKNPAIRSPRLANWEGILVEARGDREVQFHLKKPFAPFLENTSMGILPKHLWEKVTPEEFGLSQLNTHPIGSGPFSVYSLNKNTAGSITSYELRRFKRYQPSPAHLSAITFLIFPSEDKLMKAVENGAVGTAAIEHATIPKTSTVIEMRLPRIVGVFFNQDTSTILRDPVLRDALTRATDRDRIIREAEAGHAVPTSLAIPPGTFAHASTLESTARDLEGAGDILKRAGYEDTDGDGIIEKVAKKEKTKIAFTVATLQTPELIKTAELLKDMWHDISVDIAVQFYEQGDFEQNIIRSRNYDAILFGQAIGYYPDPFAFWHTSQRVHPGLNIALYANTKVDALLETARTTVQADKREEFYKFFQEEIVKDKPAVFLFSPTFLYIVPINLRGIDTEYIASPQERFVNIEAWYTDTKSVWNILLAR